MTFVIMKSDLSSVLSEYQFSEYGSAESYAKTISGVVVPFIAAQEILLLRVLKQAAKAEARKALIAEIRAMGEIIRREDYPFKDCCSQRIKTIIDRLEGK